MLASRSSSGSVLTNGDDGQRDHLLTVKVFRQLLSVVLKPEFGKRLMCALRDRRKLRQAELRSTARLW